MSNRIACSFLNQRSLSRGGGIQSTTMTSLPFSHSLSFSSFPVSPPQHHGKQILLRNPKIPLSPTNFSSGSSTLLCRNGNWVSPRRRFNAKPAKSEADIDQTSQVTEEKITVTENAGNPSTSFLSVLCPLLNIFGVATSSLSTLARLPWGSRSILGSSHNQESSENPPTFLQLYEFEACPFCRRVREAMTELDLSVEVYPCPKGSLRHREAVRIIGGKEQFPFLVDPNTGISMFESGDIVKYLFQQYGQGIKPSTGLLESTLFTGWMPTIFRAGRGLALWAKAKPETPPKKLELFSYENNPYARIVREALCELELPYILHNVGEGSPKSDLLIQKSGSKEAPYLVDPNTGIQLGDYKKILSYLFQTYADED
ncbi:hypothetical protein CKAN_01941500 [Cinnamomum micranthum f. kanehirae]|uniref:GST N-terminal domain-containing protein n=1 Tax=Cinnamomum micranthum f. kanehirae TaxID=337451 RepID=A0A3S3PGW4_9MAGN|nr:hypothetical protein CKAN_01941500 [Cinnamomum micranthum f. kanehirae]